MGRCRNHPDRETNFMCMKNNVYLCEECAKCMSPDIHCKFRTSCPIWFVSHSVEKWGSAAAEKGEGKKKWKVVFKPSQKETQVVDGATLLEASREAGVYLNASCNGQGACGKCKLVVERGEVETKPTPLLSDSEKERGYVLGCGTTVHGEVDARIPDESIEKKMKVAGMGKTATARLSGLVTDIDPMVTKVSLELKPPTLQDSASDLDRLRHALGKAGVETVDLIAGLGVVRKLGAAVRDGDWKVTASILKNGCVREVVNVETGVSGTGSLGLAIDIGTTSIVSYLVDMSNGGILSATSGHNGQAACGDDVINRIICAEKNGVKKLSEMALATINGLIAEALDAAGAEPGRIENVVVSGNTTMMHLFLEICARNIRREPYIPTVSAFPILKAGELGLQANPDAAVFVMPSPASYIGGDIVAGVLFSGLYKEQPLTLFIDVGTNGEIVLGNCDWMMAASCSAGPAFEGGGVRWGMRAEEGAIEKVRIDPSTLASSFSVIGDGRPRGLCGSGMIDLLSEMLRTKIMDRNGSINLDGDHPRIRQFDYGREYIVALAKETLIGEDIVFTEADIDNIKRAKGAIYAGFSVLLGEAGMDFSMVDRILIGGGFGRFLDIEKSVTIGLLPDIDRSKFKYLGNSSISGAYLALLSGEKREEAKKIARSITYIDFSSHGRFMEEYAAAMFFPHTNISNFPSVKAMV